MELITDLVMVWSWLFSFLYFGVKPFQKWGCIFVSYIRVIFSWYFLCKCKLEDVILSDSWVSGSHDVDGRDLMRHNWVIFSLILSPLNKTLLCPTACAKPFSSSSKVAGVFRKALFFFIGKTCLGALESGFWFGVGWFLPASQRWV